MRYGRKKNIVYTREKIKGFLSGTDALINYINPDFLPTKHQQNNNILLNDTQLNTQSKIDSLNHKKKSLLIMFNVYKQNIKYVGGSAALPIYMQ